MIRKILTTLAFSSLCFASDAQAPSLERAQNTYQYTAKNYDYLIGLKGFSKKLLTNHFELYQGYVNQTNKLDNLLRNMINQPNFSPIEFSSLKKAYAFEFNGMKLHELYFENLDKSSILDTQSSFYQAINDSFGSFEAWKKDFMQTGLSRGIGWVMCFYDSASKRLINSWIESHERSVPVFDNIMIIMDCWEHAYLQDYGINRKDYIQSFIDQIRWSKVIERFENINKQ